MKFQSVDTSADIQSLVLNITCHR